MERALDQLTTALERAQSELARERVARLREDEGAESDDAVFARHGWLFGQSAREILDELEDRRWLPEASRAALFGQLAALARERALVPTRRTLDAWPDRALPIDDADVSVQAAWVELQGKPTAPRRVGLELGLLHLAERAHRPIAERLVEAEAASERFAARATGDVDRIEPEVDKRAEATLTATDDLADEVLEFLRTRIDGELRTPFALLRALRAPELDDLVPARSRATRVAELLRPAGLDERLVRRARVERLGPSPRLSATLLLPTADAVRIVPSRYADGILGELAMIQAAGRALSVLHAHPAAPSWLRRPRRGVLGRSVGAMLARAAFEPHELARRAGIPAAVLDRGRRVAAAAMLFALRYEAARTLARSGHDAGAVLRRATRLDVDDRLAGLLSLSAGASVRFDALLTGITIHGAFRERFDEGYLRSRELPELLRSLLLRVTTDTPHVIFGVVPARPGVRDELRGFFEGRLR